MAKSTLPTAKQRRKLLAETDASLGPQGLTLLEQNRWGEALQCLTAAGQTEGIAELAARAWEAGDLFFWQQAKQVLGQEPTAAEYSQLADKAQALGKEVFAQQARGLAQGDQG